MRECPIEITDNDELILRELLAELEAGRGDAGYGTNRATWNRLRHELDRARIVSADQVGSKVVTMHSRVVLRDETSCESMTYTLVHPKLADHDASRLSVLAPIGMAILGYREGDLVEWEVPAGIRRIRIQEVLFQPEAAGRSVRSEVNAFSI